MPFIHLNVSRLLNSMRNSVHRIVFSLILSLSFSHFVRSFSSLPFASYLCRSCETAPIFVLLSFVWITSVSIADLCTNWFDCVYTALWTAPPYSSFRIKCVWLLLLELLLLLPLPSSFIILLMLLLLFLHVLRFMFFCCCWCVLCFSLPRKLLPPKKSKNVWCVVRCVSVHHAICTIYEGAYCRVNLFGNEGAHTDNRVENTITTTIKYNIIIIPYPYP